MPKVIEAPFILKLKKLVDSKNTNNLIHWDKGGKSFTITDETSFAKELLPLLFKHNNMNSFVRQLNMYDFHKVFYVDNSIIQYEHRYFVRGRDDLLFKIQRKSAKFKRTKLQPDTEEVREEEQPNGRELLTTLFKMVWDMKARQRSLEFSVEKYKAENDQLMRNFVDLENKSDHQAQVIQSLVTFVSKYVSDTCYTKRKMPLTMPIMSSDDRVVEEIMDTDQYDLPLSQEAGPSRKVMCLPTEGASYARISVPSSTGSGRRKLGCRVPKRRPESTANDPSSSSSAPRVYSSVSGRGTSLTSTLTLPRELGNPMKDYRPCLQLVPRTNPLSRTAHASTQPFVPSISSTLDIFRQFNQTSSETAVQSRKPLEDELNLMQEAFEKLGQCEGHDIPGPSLQFDEDMDDEEEISLHCSNAELIGDLCDGISPPIIYGANVKQSGSAYPVPRDTKKPPQQVETMSAEEFVNSLLLEATSPLHKGETVQMSPVL